MSDSQDHHLHQLQGVNFVTECHMHESQAGKRKEDKRNVRVADHAGKPDENNMLNVDSHLLNHMTQIM